jgi:acid phosphatase family membrane protein YuiD
MTPYTANARVAIRAINSEETGGPPVSANAVAVGLAAAVAVAVGLAVAVASLTVTLPIIPIDSCGMQK